MSAKEFFLKTQTDNLAVKVWNSDKSDRILALHGWLDNLASFEPMAGHFKRRLHAIDMVGHGLSSTKPEGVAFQLVDAVLDLHHAIEALGWRDDVHLVGHSLGATIALLYAAAAPDHVKSLVLLEGLGPISAVPELTLDRLQQHLRQRRRLQGKRFPVYKDVEEALAARLAASDMGPSTARLIVERGLRPHEDGLTWRTDARLRIRSAHPYTEEQVLNILAGVKAPTFFLRAKPGFAFVEGIIEGRMRMLSNLKYHEIEGSHHVHMDRPQDVVSLIEDFYGRLGKATEASRALYTA